MKIKAGDIISEARIVRGMTQQQAANALGVSTRTIQNWETRAELPPLVALRVAGYYGLTPERLSTEVKTILHSFAN